MSRMSSTWSPCAAARARAGRCQLAFHACAHDRPGTPACQHAIIMTHTAMCRHGPQCTSATVQANCGKAGMCQTHTSRLQIAITRLWRTARDPLRAAQAVPTSRWRACAAHTSAARTLPHLRFTAHLVAGVVHQDVDPVKVLDSLVHDLPASARSMHHGHYRSTTRSSIRPVVCIKVKHRVSARQRLHVQQIIITQIICCTCQGNTTHGTASRSAWDGCKVFTGTSRLRTGRPAPAPPCGQPPRPPAASPARMPPRLEICIAAVAIYSTCDAGMGILHKRSNRPNSSPHNADRADQAL